MLNKQKCLKCHMERLEEFLSRPEGKLGNDTKEKLVKLFNEKWKNDKQVNCFPYFNKYGRYYMPIDEKIIPQECPYRLEYILESE